MKEKGSHTSLAALRRGFFVYGLYLIFAAAFAFLYEILTEPGPPTRTIHEGAPAGVQVLEAFGLAASCVGRELTRYFRFLALAALLNALFWLILPLFARIPLRRVILPFLATVVMVWLWLVLFPTLLDPLFGSYQAVTFLFGVVTMGVVRVFVWDATRS